MTTMVQRSGLLGALLACLLVVACSPLKDAAEAAIADANAALQKVAPDGEKYAPTEYATVNQQVAAMKAAYEKKDYEAVMKTVHDLAPNLRTLAEAVNDNKHKARVALNDQWSAMTRDVPKSLSAVETRVAELGKAHKLPKGVSKDALAGAGAEVDAAKQSWSEAESARKAGNAEDAIAKGKSTEEKLSALMASLGMSGAGAAMK